MPIRPWRGPGPDRPVVPLPPERDAAAARRPAAEAVAVRRRVRAGADAVRRDRARRSAAAAWWAVWDRTRGRLLQRSAKGSGGVEVEDGRLRRSPAGRCAASSRSRPASRSRSSRRTGASTLDAQAGRCRATGRIEIARRAATRVDLRAVVDESRGLPRAPHRLAVVGRGRRRRVGAAVALEPRRGPARRAGRVRAHGLGRRRAASTSPRSRSRPTCRPRAALTLPAEATRARARAPARRASDYEQPFGTFAGELPVAGPLAEGCGVMERHDVRW